MHNQFTNCPKCGTRNFADDKECGICKAKLTSPAIVKSNENSTNKASSNRTGVLIFFAAVCVMAYYYSQNEKKSYAPKTYVESALSSYDIPEPELQYEIIETIKNNTSRFGFTVRIKHKASENQLLTIAKKVRAEIETKSDQGTIFFLLPEMNISESAWAAVDFNPAMQVRMLGKSIDDEQKIYAGLDNIKDYVGLWMHNSAGEVVIRIRQNNKQQYYKEFVSTTDPKPDVFATLLEKTKIEGKVVYLDTEDTEQYYVVEANGDLSAYDSYGYIETYKRLK